MARPDASGTRYRNDAAVPGTGLVYEVRVARTNRCLALRAKLARSWRERFVGLLGHRSLAEGDALILPRCRAIHMVGMRFAIDAIFVDRAWRVVALHPGVQPGSIGLPVWRAWGVIEASAGTIQGAGVELGDQLQLTAVQGDSGLDKQP